MFAPALVSPKPKKKSPEPWKPHAYQRKAVKWLLSRRGAALFLDPGLGKTSIAYAAVKVLRDQGLSKGALVVAPRRPAQLVWPAEQQKWADFAGLKVVLLHGDKKDKLLAEETADVWVITYEGIEWLFKEPTDKRKEFTGAELVAENARYLAARKVHLARLKLLFSKVDIFIPDELSKLKHTNTVRFRALKPHLAKFDFRWGLTGSPASNGLEDLFGEIYVLDMGKALGEFVTHFRSRYFLQVPAYPGDPYPPLVPKEGADKDIYKALKNVALRIDAEDHLKLPQIIYNPIRFDLPPDVRKMYNEMERDMLLSLPTGKVFTAKTAATVSQKCRQITSGAIYEDPVDPLTGEPISGARKWEALHTLKLDMLEELRDSLEGQQLLCAYEFVHEVERIKALYPKKSPPAIVGGGTSDKEAARCEREWNLGHLPELYGHPASIGHGLNLQESSAYNVCWFSGTWDYELLDQFQRRLKRQGNTAKHLFVHWFIARDTIDEAVYAASQRKRKDQNTLLDALKEYRSSRM